MLVEDERSNLNQPMVIGTFEKFRKIKTQEESIKLSKRKPKILFSLNSMGTGTIKGFEKDGVTDQRKFLVTTTSELCVIKSGEDGRYTRQQLLEKPDLVKVIRWSDYFVVFHLDGICVCDIQGSTIWEDLSVWPVYDSNCPIIMSGSQVFLIDSNRQLWSIDLCKAVNTEMEASMIFDSEVVAMSWNSSKSRIVYGKELNTNEFSLSLKSSSEAATSILSVPSAYVKWLKVTCVNHQNDYVAIAGIGGKLALISISDGKLMGQFSLDSTSSGKKDWVFRIVFFGNPKTSFLGVFTNCGDLSVLSTSEAKLSLIAKKSLQRSNDNEEDKKFWFLTELVAKQRSKDKIEFIASTMFSLRILSLRL